MGNLIRGERSVTAVSVQDASPAEYTSSGTPRGRSRTPFTLRDLLIIGFYHRRAIILSALIPILIGLVAAIETRTQYTANGLLMVLVTREFAGNQDVLDTGPTVLSVEGLKSVEGEVNILGSADVIRKTIDDIGVSTLFPDTARWWYPQFLFGPPQNVGDRLIKRFRDAFRAEVQSDSNIIQVSFTNPDRALAVRVVDRLIANYLEHRRALFANPRYAPLAEHVIRVTALLEQTEAAIEEAKRAADVIDISQDRLLAVNQVDAIIQRIRQVRERREAVIGQMEVAQKEKQALDETVFDFKELSNAATNDDDSNFLTRLQAERQQLLSKFAPTHPQIQLLDRQIATVRNILRNPEQKVAWTSRDVRNPAVSFMTNMILGLKVELDALDKQLVELDAQRVSADARVNVLRDADRRLATLERQHSVLSDAYKEYVRRAEAAQIEEFATQTRLSNVRVVQEARDAVTSRNMALPYLLAGLVGGALVGGAAGLCATSLRTIYITPDEAAASTGLPALTSFTEELPDPGAPQNRQALSNLVTHLLDIPIDNRSLSTLLITDVSAPQDRELLVDAIAHEISAARKLRTLLINVPDHDTHEADTPPTEEVADSKAVSCAIEVRETDVAGLDIALPSVELPFGGSRISTTRAREILDELRERYDVILLSAPVSTEGAAALRLAPVVDANLIVIRAERSRALSVLRLRDAILDAGGGLAGFVMTGRKYYLPEWIYKWA